MFKCGAPPRWLGYLPSAKDSSLINDTPDHLSVIMSTLLGTCKSSVNSSGWTDPLLITEIEYPLVSAKTAP